MYENFSEPARKVMQFANQEAQRWGHEYIGTEHILLGFIKEPSGEQLIQGLNLAVPKVRAEVEMLMEHGPGVTHQGTIPRTPRTTRVMEYANEERRNLNSPEVYSSHLLLGLIRVEDGTAAKALINLGVTLERVRDEVVKMSLPRPTVSPWERVKQLIADKCPIQVLFGDQTLVVEIYLALTSSCGPNENLPRRGLVEDITREYVVVKDDWVQRKYYLPRAHVRFVE